MPSLARTAAAYEPAGPPPMTRTWVCYRGMRLVSYEEGRRTWGGRDEDNDMRVGGRKADECQVLGGLDFIPRRH